MKNFLFTQKGIPLLVFCLLSGLAIAQKSLTVGEVRNGAGVITDPLAAAAALKWGLSGTATISNLRLEWVGGNENQYYLVGNVDGSNISAKAISLHRDGGVLSAKAGPGIEVTCVGVDCGKCDVVMVKGRWLCSDCQLNNNPPKTGHCDMVTKIHIGL